jgi:hypothetical protein
MHQIASKAVKRSKEAIVAAVVPNVSGRNDVPRLSKKKVNEMQTSATHQPIVVRFCLKHRFIGESL